MQRPLLAAAILVPTCLGLPRAVLAQPKASTNEIEVYGGELFGQRLTAQPLAGALDPNPRLADHPTYGVRLSHSFSDEWGVELGVGQTRTQTARHPAEQPGVSNLRLQTADLDVTWNFTSDGPIRGYTLMGAGYARTRLEPDLTNPNGGDDIRGRNTATANLGIGARGYLTGHLIFRAEVRYRFLGHLLTDNARSVSALETTFGVGWRF